MYMYGEIGSRFKLPDNWLKGCVLIFASIAEINIVFSSQCVCSIWHILS